MIEIESYGYCSRVKWSVSENVWLQTVTEYFSSFKVWKYSPFTVIYLKSCELLYALLYSFKSKSILFIPVKNDKRNQMYNICCKPLGATYITIGCYAPSSQYCWKDFHIICLWIFEEDLYLAQNLRDGLYKNGRKLMYYVNTYK